MATIYTRAAKGSALTWTEGDANITNLNNAKIENVVEDTTPQLGGDLDVNGKVITSASNGNVAITPNGTGSVVLDGQSWPQADGSANQVLKTNGAGQLSWTTPAAGTVTSVGGTGTVSGISLSGSVTSTGNLTLGGTLDLSSPPAIGGTSANTISGTTITATTQFSGPGTGLTGTASSLSIGGNAATATSATSATTATSATSATTATNANNINISTTDGNTSDTLMSVVLVADQVTGNQAPHIDGGLQYNASTNTLTATTFSGALSGNATTATTATNVSGTVAIANGGTGQTTAPAAMAALIGFTTTATTNNGSTTLTSASSYYQVFTGTGTSYQVNLPSTATLAQGWSYHIVNNNSVSITVATSTAGGNWVIPSGVTMMATVVSTANNNGSAWETGFTDFSTLTGSGNVVLSTSPTLTTPNLGTPSAIVLTNASGTASININGTVGATTASSGAFTTLSASSTVSGTGFSTYLASPPAIGGTTAAAGSFTTLSATTTATTQALSVTYNPSSASGAAIFATGKDSQGGVGYFDFLKITNTTSGATNANKTFRTNSTGELQIVNSAYGATIFALGDNGAMIVGGTTFPTATGTNGQVLTANGSGGSSWTTPSSGSSVSVALLESTGYNITIAASASGTLLSSVGEGWVEIRDPGSIVSVASDGIYNSRFTLGAGTYIIELGSTGMLSSGSTGTTGWVSLGGIQFDLYNITSSSTVFTYYQEGARIYSGSSSTAEMPMGPVALRCSVAPTGSTTYSIKYTNTSHSKQFNSWASPGKAFSLKITKIA